MVKSIKVEKINISQEERKNMVNDALKKGKKKNISQMDMERPGGFQQSSPEEEKLIIDGKLQQRIHIQNDLRKQELACGYTWCEIEELEKIYNNYNEPEYLSGKDDVIDLLNSNKKFVEKPQWYGIDMPKKVLAMEINCKVHDWKDMVGKRNYLVQALKNVGFDMDKHIKPILIEGKIISDKKLLQEIEKEHNKKNLTKDET
jgi:hypothetical protein